MQDEDGVFTFAYAKRVTARTRVRTWKRLGEYRKIVPIKIQADDYSNLLCKYHTGNFRSVWVVKIVYHYINATSYYAFGTHSQAREYLRNTKNTVSATGNIQGLSFTGA